MDGAVLVQLGRVDVDRKTVHIGRADMHEACLFIEARGDAPATRQTAVHRARRANSESGHGAQRTRA
eukprot:2392496-Prymnesium_polylepis.1